MDKKKDIKTLNNLNAFDYLSQKLKNHYKNSSKNDSEFELINEKNIIYSLQCPQKNYYANSPPERYNNPLPKKKYVFSPEYSKKSDGCNSPISNFSYKNKIGRSPNEFERKMDNISLNDRYNFYKTDSSKYDNTEANEIFENMTDNLCKNNYNNYKKNLVIQTTNNIINNNSAVKQNINNNKINNMKYININKYSNNSIGKNITKKISINDENNNSAQKKTKPEIKSYISKYEIPIKNRKKDKIFLTNNFNNLSNKEKHSNYQIQNNDRNKEKIEPYKTSTIRYKFNKMSIKTKENDINYKTVFENEKPYLNSIKFQEDKNNKETDIISNKNITVKRNESLKLKKEKKIFSCNSNKDLLGNNIKNINGIDINNNNKVVYSNRNNLVKGSPMIIKKNQIIKKIYLKPGDNSNNINNIDSDVNSISKLKINLNKNSTKNENRLKSPETVKIYQKPKNPKINQKKMFVFKSNTPDKISDKKKIIKPSTIDNINNSNEKISNRNKYYKIRKMSTVTEDSYKLENKNDLDSSNDYLSRLNHLRENLCRITDKVINKKNNFITKYYNFFLDKQLIDNRPCYLSKTYIQLIHLPKIKNCFFSKNYEVVYTINKNKTNCYYTKIRKIVKSIVKMPVDDICVYSKNIIYDRFKKKPKNSGVKFNDNIDIINENILIKPTKYKKRKKRRKTRRLHKMTEKEIEEQKLKQKNENENENNNKDNDKEEKTDEEENECISGDEKENNNIILNNNLNNDNSINNTNNNNNNSTKNINENERSTVSKNDIKSNIQQTNINDNNNKSKLKSPIFRKSNNQSSILSEIEINLGDIEKNQNQIKNSDIGFSYEDGYKDNEDFHIESDEEDEEEKSIKKRTPKKMGRTKKNFGTNEQNKVTLGKEINDDIEYTPHKKTNHNSSGKMKDSGGYLMLRRQKLMKMIENIQKKRDKITKIHNYNIANQKKLMAFNKLSEIFSINDKKQKIGQAINKIEEIIEKKVYRNEEDSEENNIENNTENNIENNINKNINDNINKYKEIFELNPIKKLELIMNKQFISNSNSENNNTTSDNKNNTHSENNNITNSDNNCSNQFLSEINNTNSFNITSLNNEKKYTYEEILSLSNNNLCVKNNLLNIEVIKHCTEILKETKIFSSKNPILKSADFARSNIRKCPTDNSSMSQWARKDMTKEINQAEKYVQDLNKNLSKDVFKHKIIEILNTLTVDNYNNILKKLIEMIFLGEKENKNKLLKSEYLLHNQSVFVEIILDKATIEKSYVILYAKLCADLYTELLRLINDYINHEIKNQLINGENLKTILIGECQQRFDEINTNLDIINNNENFISMKKKFLGNLNFIAELINVKIISQTLGFKFLDILYKRYKEMSEHPKIKFLNLEGAVILLGKFGKIVTDRRNPKHVQNLDNFINDKLFLILSNNEKDLPNYLKYKIINLIEKKKNNWKDSLYENSINAKGKYCNFIVNSDEDVEENGDKIIIDESFDENGFNKDNGANRNEDEEKMKEDNIITLLKEDIENYISFLNENNIYNKKDIEDYFIQNDNYDINNEYNWAVVNELIVKLKIELEEIIRCYLEVCIDYVTKENIIFYVNEYIKNIINYYGLDLSSTDISRFQSSIIKLFLNVEDVCVDNRYMWEVMGFLLSVLISNELYTIDNFNEFSDKDRGTLVHISNVIKFSIAYYAGDINALVKKIKDLDVFKKNKDLFMENIVEPLKNKCEMNFDG